MVLLGIHVVDGPFFYHTPFTGDFVFGTGQPKPLGPFLTFGLEGLPVRLREADSLALARHFICCLSPRFYLLCLSRAGWCFFVFPLAGRPSRGAGPPFFISFNFFCRCRPQLWGPATSGRSFLRPLSACLLAFLILFPLSPLVLSPRGQFVLGLVLSFFSHLSFYIT